MTIYNIGDQARAYALQMATGRLKTSMTVLTQELASGESADIGARLRGNTTSLSAIEARLSALEQFKRNASEAAILTRGLGEVLESVRRDAAELGQVLANEPFSGTGASLSVRAGQATTIFDAAVQRLNATAGGHFLFSGLASDRPPLASAAQMLDALSTVTAGLTTASDVAAAVGNWFDAPPGGGGFLDTAYFGTIGESRRIPIADNMAISLGTSAASPEVRELLKALATAAIVDRNTLPGQDDQRGALVELAGRKLLAAEQGLIKEQGRLGLTEQIIDRSTSMSAAAVATLQLSRADIRNVDVVETAAALKQVDGQLEALYAVTARLAKLKLVDFLR